MYSIRTKSILQIPSIELHVTDFLKHDLLHLVAVLLVLVPAGLLWLVGADQSLLFLTNRLDALLLALVADLLRLEMTVLLLYGEGEDVGELFTIPVNISLANLNLNLTRDVVAALCWLP